jgi:hypothetical protein
MDDKIATVRGVSLATLIPICITLTTVGLILISIGIVAPAWGTVDISERSQVCVLNIILDFVYRTGNSVCGRTVYVEECTFIMVHNGIVNYFHRLDGWIQHNLLTTCRHLTRVITMSDQVL